MDLSLSSSSILLQLLGVVCFSEICAQDVVVSVRHGKSSLQEEEEEEEGKGSSIFLVSSSAAAAAARKSSMHTSKRRNKASN